MTQNQVNSVQLIGSDNQIKWANDIRVEFLDQAVAWQSRCMLPDNEEEGSRAYFEALLLSVLIKEILQISDAN